MKILFAARIEYKSAFHIGPLCRIATYTEMYNIFSVVTQFNTAKMKPLKCTLHVKSRENRTSHLFATDDMGWDIILFGLITAVKKHR